MFGAETCSEGSFTSTRSRRDQGRIGFPAPSGSRRLSEEVGSTAHEIWITLVAPGQVIALDRPEHDRSVLLAYRGEIEIEWEDFTVLHLRSGELAWLNPPTPRALRNTGGGDAAFLTFSTKESSDSCPQT